MKRLTILVLGVVLGLGAMVVSPAQAGWFKKSKEKRTEKPDWMKTPKRYAGAPMSFHAGVLRQDGSRGWMLGETEIQFSPDCIVTNDAAEEGHLAAGREAIIMGTRIGQTIYALSVRVSSPEFANGMSSDPGVKLKPSNTNPSCGEIVKAPL